MDQLAVDRSPTAVGAAVADMRPAAVIALTSFLVTFDVTAVIVAMPRIKAELGLDVAGFAWVMDAYSLAFTALLMAAGVLADRHGRRRAALAGNALFALASLACGLARTDVELWTARAWQGVGAAFVICGGLALLSERYREPAMRARAFALAGTVSGMAMALGPAGGGLIAEWLGWRWIFFVNLPLCLLIAWALPRVVGESRAAAHRPLDLAALASLTVALAALVAWLLHGGAIAMLACMAGAGAFALSQRRSPAPLLDRELLARPAFVGICVVPLMLAIGYWALLVYLPLFLEQGLGIAPQRIAPLLLVATLPMLALPAAAARLAARWPARRLFALGLALVAAGDALLAAAALGASSAAAVAGMFVLGCGAALINAQISGAIVALAPSDRAGTVSALATVLRQGGFVSGIAMLGALLAMAPPARALAAPFALPFAVAGVATLAGAFAVWRLVPQGDPRRDR